MSQSAISLHGESEWVYSLSDAVRALFYANTAAFILVCVFYLCCHATLFRLAERLVGIAQTLQNLAASQGQLSPRSQMIRNKRNNDLVALFMGKYQNDCKAEWCVFVLITGVLFCYTQFSTHPIALPLLAISLAMMLVSLGCMAVHAYRFTKRCYVEFRVVKKMLAIDPDLGCLERGEVTICNSNEEEDLSDVVRDFIRVDNEARARLIRFYHLAESSGESRRTA